MELSDIALKLQERNYDINEAKLEIASQLLTEYGFESSIPNIISVAVIKHDNPSLSNAQAINQALEAEKNRANNSKQGYGVDFANNLVNQIVEGFEESGLIDHVADRVERDAHDRVMKRLNNRLGISESIQKRNNALNSGVNQMRNAFMSSDIIDAEYTESNPSIDDILLSLSPAKDEYKLIKAGETFQSSNEPETIASGNGKKKLLNGASTTGEKN